MLYHHIGSIQLGVPKKGGSVRGFCGFPMAGGTP